MSNKKKNSRFDELIDAARSRQNRDELTGDSEQSSRKTKSTDPDYVRTTFYLPKLVHRKLKTVAVSQERQMSDIVTELLEQWLAEEGGKE
ncbi:MULTISPECIES: CopG family transcriptional regulator [Cyanophyceae]|uniref:CopG family transcriptional regulator n=1 Tax=Cyanophyceae TaxID=3028117 RepID=UPI000B4A2845|nr:MULTISPECIES: CopG family transcriptional regulator [Cyanophyceae]NQZ65222.1 CopG family transcriptional regulator [Crocosphaera sp.]